MSKLRMGIVGCGERGRANFAASRQSKHVATAMVMDSNEQLAETLGQDAGVRWTTEFAAMLESPDVDFIFLATPHHLHTEQAICALEADKHVLVEKPLATNLKDAKKMVEVTRRCKKELSCWLGFRFLPEVQKAKEIFSKALLGEVHGACFAHQLLKPPSYYESGYSALSSSDWRGRWETAGGGVFIMNAAHYLDWIPYLTGCRITSISARYATLGGSSEVEDSIVFWATLENGALISGHSSACVQGFHAVPLTEFRVWGSEGHVSLSEPAQFFLTRVFDGAKPERWNKFRNLAEINNVNVEMLDRFAGPILKGGRPEVTAEHGLELQAIIEAAYRSVKEKKLVSVEYP